MEDIRNRMRNILSGARYFTELRYHKKSAKSISSKNGESDQVTSKRKEGIGIRVLYKGCWGFCSSSDLSTKGIELALSKAEKLAIEMSLRKSSSIELKSTSRLAKGEFVTDGYLDLLNHNIAEKWSEVKKVDEKIRNSYEQINTAACTYTEIFEDKIILSSDGADCLLQISRPELRMIAIAGDGKLKSMGRDSLGGTGNWDCLFKNRSIEEATEITIANAMNLLKAKPGSGGRKKVILSPAMVGLLSHEAIGHPVEADFVKSGSIARDLFNKEVASSLVNLTDSGFSEYKDGAGGDIPVDDEGILGQRTEIIKNGKLVNYLHNRESAAEFGVEPTGNARAWEFNDSPLIRMRNTYIEPGKSELEDMIGEIEDGYLIDGPEGGQADATAEFMFGANKVKEIKNGKIANNVQKVTVSGNAFDVLKSVDAVSKDFKWDLGAGYCGKGQPAKVDAGGPYLRCEILVGGAQN